MSSDELWAAARSGDEARVRALLASASVDVNHVSSAGSTALCEASEKGHTSIVTALLAAHGVRVAATDRLGWSPLHLAAYYNRADVVALLVAAHAPLDARNVDEQSTPLHLAALADAVDVVRTLLPHLSPALTAALDARGKRPLDLAASPEIAALLDSASASSSTIVVPPAARLPPSSRLARRAADPLERGPAARPKLPSVARTGPSGPRPPRGGAVGAPPGRAPPGELLDASAPPERAFSPPLQRPPAMHDSVQQRTLSPPPRKPPHADAKQRTLSPPPRKPPQVPDAAPLPQRALAASGPARRALTLAPARRQMPARAPPTSSEPLKQQPQFVEADTSAEALPTPPRVSRVPLPSFSSLPGAPVPAVSEGGDDSPSLARRAGDSVLILKVAELEAQNKKLRSEVSELKAARGTSDGADSAAAALRVRVKQLEDQLELMELALPIKAGDQSKPTLESIKATFFKSLSKLDDGALQNLLQGDKSNHLTALVVDALEQQRPSSGEAIGLAAVALAQAVANAVGKLDERNAAASSDAVAKRSVMTNRLTSSGLSTLMPPLAHLAANGATCCASVHRATRALFLSMLSSGLMVRAADGGLATVAPTNEADEARRKGLERNLSSMHLTTEAKPTSPTVPRKVATQYQSMPGMNKGAAEPESPKKPAPVSTKAAAAAAATATATAAVDAELAQLPRGRTAAAGPTRTRGRRASSVEAPRFQASADAKAAEQQQQNRTLSPGRRIMGVLAPKTNKAKVEKSSATAKPAAAAAATTTRREGRNLGGVATVDIDGVLLVRSAQAADASGRLFADASKAVDTSFALANVLLLSNGHLEYRRMPTGSAQEAKEAAQSLRGQSLAAVCARLLKDCGKLSAVMTSDLSAARETAKNMILKVRELKRVVTDVVAFAPRFGASDDVAARCDAAMSNLSNVVATLVKLAKEDLSDETVKLDVDNRAKQSTVAVATAMRALLDVLPAQCRVMVTSAESSGGGEGAAPLEPGVIVHLSGATHDVAIDSTSECLFRVRDKAALSNGWQFKSRSEDVMMDWVNAFELCGLSATF